MEEKKLTIVGSDKITTTGGQKLMKKYTEQNLTISCDSEFPSKHEQNSLIKTRNTFKEDSIV